MIGYDLDRSPWATRPRAILEEAIRRGWDVSVIDLEEQGKQHQPIHPSIENCPGLKRITLRQKYYSTLDTPLALISARKKVLPLLAEADVVHIQKPKILTWAVAKWAVNRGLPVVYDWDDLEGSGGIRSGISGWKVDRIESWFAKNSSEIVAASTALQDFIQSKYSPRAPVVPGPCGVDVEKFNPASISAQSQELWRERLDLADEKVLIYHGQMEMGHSGEALLMAIREAAERHKFRLLVVGGGPVQQKIESLAMQFGLKREVVFTGYVPFDEIPILLSLASIAICLIPDTPYGRCKSPLKLYEAMAMGLPVVAANVGQPAEALKKCGVLVPPNNSSALAEAIKRLVEEPEEAERLGDLARKQAIEKHQWNRLGGLFIDLYHKHKGRH